MLALQLLPPRQRAALILRDVLAWRSGEVAELLETSTAAVNSALQRARVKITQNVPIEDELVEPELSFQRDVLDQYVAAFERADMSTLSQLLRHDAVLEMPPFLSWFAGHDAIARFFAHVWGRRERDAWRMLPTGANRQPAVAAYLRADDGVRRAHSVQVYTITSSGIARIVAFVDPTLFETFGMPAVWSPERTGL